MCELLGMSANVPTDICFSFTGLMQRGGKTGPHKDGWGIAFYEEKRCRTFHDPQPSVDSPIAELIHQYPIKSRTVISHIRQATHGKVCLENTHPFVRELWGRAWCFAHNGKLPGVKKRALSHYKPIGTTDSEYAFCWLLGEIRQRWPNKPPRFKTLHKYIEKLSETLAIHGTFNMLLSDSNHMYCFCTTYLCWLTRKAPFKQASLIDTELTVNFKEVTSTNDIVTVIATKPLTQYESWTSFKSNHLYTFRDGICISCDQLQSHLDLTLTL
jgi:predicted glutamine amidotransferase